MNGSKKISVDINPLYQHDPSDDVWDYVESWFKYDKEEPRCNDLISKSSQLLCMHFVPNVVFAMFTDSYFKRMFHKCGENQQTH